jgi:2-dehydro-3-deoxyphosphogluconate aldolase / (4S)-4-hydroxy-2-oxoglutarate aldolase
MNPEQALERIGEIGVIPVIRAASSDQAIRAVEAVEAGGIPIVEITMTVPDAIPTIREVVSRCGRRVLVGAGTVCDASQARACLQAGAEFLVSPGLSLEVLEAAAEAGKLAAPGALTPTEVMAAAAAGARLIKIFPCGSVGGAKHIKALRAPFPDLLFVPTGGVNAQNVADFFRAGAFAVGMGGDLIDAVALRENRTDEVVASVRAVAEAVKAARGKKS